MPAAAMLVPLAIQAGGAIASHYAGKKATKAAQQRSPEEVAALSGATGAAKSTGEAGSSLLDESRPYMSKAGGYYGTLLNGNRAAMMQATAAPRGVINQQYAGAASKLGTSGIRGAAKDVLAGQLNRQKVAQTSGLTTGVQPGAANALAGLGTDMSKTAAPLMATSGNIYSNLLGAGADNRKYARSEGERTSKNIMSLATNASNIVGGQMSKGSAAGGTNDWDTGQYT